MTEPVGSHAGQRLGPYELRSLVGAGGMGEVYRAHDPRLGREVAVKVLAPSFTADSDRVRRLFLATGPCCPDPALLAEHPDLVVATPTPAQLETLAVLFPPLDARIWPAR